MFQVVLEAVIVNYKTIKQTLKHLIKQTIKHLIKYKYKIQIC